MRKNKILISIYLLSAFIFTACTGTSSYKTSDYAVRQETNNEIRETAVDNGGFSDSISEGYAPGYDIQENVNASSGNPSTSQTANPEQSDDYSRMLIRRVFISGQTEDFDGTDALVRSMVNEYGGYFDSASVSGTGTNYNYRVGDYEIRIPENNLDTLIDALDGTCTVVSRSDSTEDVTLQYIDNQSHIESLRAEQEALLNMLSNADEMDQIILIQNELSNIRYQIESLESSQRYLMNQVTFSTLTLRIEEVVEVKPEENTRTESFGDKASRRFKNSLKDIKNGFEHLILEIIAVSPILISMILFAAIVLIIVFTCFKIKKKKIMKKNNLTDKSDSDNTGNICNS